LLAKVMAVAGVVVLLLLAELLRDYAGPFGLKLLAFNGEGYYAASGEIDYLAQHLDRLGDIALAINLDAVGHIGHRTAYSLYGCPAELADLIRTALATPPEVVEGEPWYQSDHSVFFQRLNRDSKELICERRNRTIS